eukprot:1039894-Pleurochrysis_carterae.AAC.1
MAKNNVTDKEVRSSQTSPPRVEPSMGHARFSHSESALCGRHQYGAPLRPRRYERSARLRGACFEA